MLFPSKVISYEESVLSKLPPLLRCLQQRPMGVKELYQMTYKSTSSVCDFMDALDCLFALGRIEYDSEREVIYYVEGNIL